MKTEFGVEVTPSGGLLFDHMTDWKKLTTALKASKRVVLISKGNAQLLAKTKKP